MAQALPRPVELLLGVAPVGRARVGQAVVHHPQPDEGEHEGGRGWIRRPPPSGTGARHQPQKRNSAQCDDESLRPSTTGGTSRPTPCPSSRRSGRWRWSGRTSGARPGGVRLLDLVDRRPGLRSRSAGLRDSPRRRSPCPRAAEPNFTGTAARRSPCSAPAGSPPANEARELVRATTDVLVAGGEAEPVVVVRHGQRDAVGARSRRTGASPSGRWRTAVAELPQVPDDGRRRRSSRSRRADRVRRGLRDVDPRDRVGVRRRRPEEVNRSARRSPAPARRRARSSTSPAPGS